MLDPVRVELPNGMRIHEFNLVYRQKFDLRFSLVKFDFAGDANDFPWERSDPPVSRNFCPGFNEPSERLIGVISSEVDQYGPEWASPDGDDEPAHLDVFAYVVNGSESLITGSSSARLAIKQSNSPRIANNGRMSEPNIASNSDRLETCKNLLVRRGSITRIFHRFHDRP